VIVFAKIWINYNVYVLCMSVHGTNHDTLF